MLVAAQGNADDGVTIVNNTGAGTVYIDVQQDDVQLLGLSSIGELMNAML
jgi:hypothetical protein